MGLVRHKVFVPYEGGLFKRDQCKLFGEELDGLQERLCTYTKMLADMAGEEDLTKMEETY